MTKFASLLTQCKIISTSVKYSIRAYAPLEITIYENTGFKRKVILKSANNKHLYNTHLLISQLLHINL